MQTSLAHLTISVLLFLTLLIVGMKLFADAVDTQLERRYDTTFQRDVCVVADDGATFFFPDPNC